MLKLKCIIYLYWIHAKIKMLKLYVLFTSIEYMLKLNALFTSIAYMLKLKFIIYLYWKHANVKCIIYLYWIYAKVKNSIIWTGNQSIHIKHIRETNIFVEKKLKF